MQNLPLFPEFRRFEASDKDWYNDFYKQFDPYIDFSFGNLRVWLDQNDDLMVARHNNNVVFSSTTVFMDNQKVINFLGTDNVAGSLDAIFAFQLTHGERPQVQGLTAAVINALGEQSQRYIVEKDRDNYEYIYALTQLATFSGGDLAQRRYQLNRFVRDFGPITATRPLDLASSSVQHDIFEGLSIWRYAYSENDLERQEKQVIERLLSGSNYENYGCLGLFIWDVLEGFLIYQLLPQGNAVGFNHTKVTYHYPNMFNYLVQQTAQSLQDTGVTIVNMEQDLGIPGLREHKLSLKPVRFLEKFTVRPR